MDASHFDAIARTLRTLGSRRTLLGSALAGLFGIGTLDDGEARRECPPCKKRKKGKCKKKRPNGTACGGGKVCQGGRCTCPSGQRVCRGACLPNSHCCSDADCNGGDVCVNGACGFACTSDGDCPSSCSVCGPLTTDGHRHCVSSPLNCASFPQECTEAADCEAGFFCMPTRCGAPPLFTNRCVGLC
jgi:hypothetical protein